MLDRNIYLLKNINTYMPSLKRMKFSTCSYYSGLYREIKCPIPKSHKLFAKMYTIYWNNTVFKTKRSFKRDG